MLPSFLEWLYKEGLAQTLAMYQSIVLLTLDFFSVKLLLRTLFAPWKRDEVEPETPSLQLIMQAFWNNLIARGIGTCVRAMTICIGCIATIFVIIGGALFVGATAAYPASVPVLIVVGAIVMTNQTFALLSIGLLLVIFGASVGITLYRMYLKNRWRDAAPATPLATALANNTGLAPWLTRRATDVMDAVLPITAIKKELALTRQGMFIINRAGLTNQEYTATDLPASVTKELLYQTAAQNAVAAKRDRIGIGDSIYATCALDPTLQSIMTQHELTLTDIASVVAWQEHFWKLLEPPSPLLDTKNLKFTGGIGKDWASGYTSFLNRFSHDLTEEVTNPLYDLQFVAHKQQINEIERVLARSGKNNVILVGETGVGKKTLVYGLARQVLVGKTLAPLAHKHLIELDLTSLLASSASPQELESSLVKLMNEATRSGNTILFVDEIARLLSSHDEGLGTTNAVQILVPYLQSSQLQLITTTTPPEYHKDIERQPNLAATFEKIDITEPTPEEVLQVLQEIAPSIEAKHHVLVTYQALCHLIKQAARYMGNRKFPEKGIDLLDEVAVETATKTPGATITMQTIDALISQKTHTPIGAADQAEKTSLLQLEDALHKRVVNQTTAIGAIANALRRSRAGVGSPNKPVGSFLFLGPTGVGKTETAKALSEVIFGSDQAMIRIDMSEYQEISAIRRLIGDETQATGGMLTDQIREHPFAVVLLDEIEKAHPKILDIFLQVLDDGRLTDALGQVADFRNAIIIATSNAGSNLIRQTIQNQTTTTDMEALSKQLLDLVQNEGTFRPEFLNRFDAVVAYRPLTVDELVSVVDRQLALINKRMEERHMSVVMQAPAKQKLAQLGFDPAFGARALVRAMTQTVENQLAQAILRGSVQSGGSFEVTQEMIQ